ncbi:integrase catalytic domain-containing protein [Trichonephila clavipes]|nr:integrase catalytic domain-containing protein [Trichonephila clavipes]
MEFYSTKSPTYGRSLGGGHKVSEISPQIKSCQKTTKVIQVVWKKWSTDYLNTLQQRGKWMIEKDNVMCGTMVIVKEDFTPVCNWLLGRVVEVYHGSDGKIVSEPYKEIRGLLATDFVVLSFVQVTRTPP